MKQTERGAAVVVALVALLACPSLAYLFIFVGAVLALLYIIWALSKKDKK